MIDRKKNKLGEHHEEPWWSHIVGSHRAFAALTDAGAVFCWGDSEAGGDCALAALVTSSPLAEQSTPDQDQR